MRTVIFILAGILLGTSGASAAEHTKSVTTRMSIDTLVRQALAENPEMRHYEAAIAVAKGEQREAGAWKNPELGGELGAKRTTGDGLDATGMLWAATVQQQFEWPGRVTLRKAIASRQVKLAEQGLAQFRTSLAAAVRQRAYALYAAQQKQKAAAEVATRGDELASTLTQREASGVTPLLENRAISASVLALRRQETEAGKEAQSALLELNQLRGYPLSATVTVEDARREFPALPPVNELLKRSSTGNFALARLATELEQQGFRVQLAKNETWPSVTAGPAVEQEYAGDQETRASLAFSLPLPVWNRNKGNIEAAKARETQARTGLILAQREVERQVREQAAAYELHRKEMARWNPKTAADLREAAELADRHYRLGSVPLATYLEVQSSYLEALDAIYSTEADAFRALAELEKLTGSKVP